jgi:hypothetical protein
MWDNFVKYYESEYEDSSSILYNRSKAPELIENAFYILTPCKSIPHSSIQALSEFIENIGSIPKAIIEAHNAPPSG